MEVRCSSPPTSLWFGGTTILVGLRTGRCDVFESKAIKMTNTVVSSTRGPVTALGYVIPSGILLSQTTCTVSANATSFSRPTQLLTTRDLKPAEAPVMDVFSPLKRKEVDPDIDTGERKEKRMKESISTLSKSTHKRISAAIVDIAKPKSSNTHRDEIRSKERQMEKDSMKALTLKSKLDKSHMDGDNVRPQHDTKSEKANRRATNSLVTKPALQASTKHNLSPEKAKTTSPGKSILKNTSPLAETVTKNSAPAEREKSPRKSILKDNSGTELRKSSHSPRTRNVTRNVQDEEISPLDDVLPDFDMASPVPTFRRKSPEKAIAPRASPEIRSTRHGSATSKDGNDSVYVSDLWDTNREPKLPVTLPPTTTIIPASRIASKPADGPSPEMLPADVNSAVLEIQTVLRRDIERLWLDMLRQFVSFRSEMGQKWEGEVGRLRQENEMLKGEIESLKKEAGKRNDRSVWRLT